MSTQSQTTGMPPLLQVLRRKLDPGAPSHEFSDQWTHPGDVFSVLLILGGDVVGRALAQLAGSKITPVAFSFGWVAYAVTAVVSAVGENKLMPASDCPCKVINGKNGFVRDNSSWIIGRIVRDFESWMDDGKAGGVIDTEVKNLIAKKWKEEKDKAVKAGKPEESVKKPIQTGLCVSVYKAEEANPGFPGRDRVYGIGFGVIIFQLGIAAIPCGLFGDWGILTITAAGTLLSFATGSLSQWQDEKWAKCKTGSDKTMVLTKGNGSQHAIVILGDGKGFDLEALAASTSNTEVSASRSTRFSVVVLALFWILLLITAAGIKQNTWFLLAIGGVGILDNIWVAGRMRHPRDFGVPLKFVEVIGGIKVRDALYALEEKYPRAGKSLLGTFFPGELRADEIQKWKDFDRAATRAEKNEELRQKRVTNNAQKIAELEQEIAKMEAAFALEDEAKKKNDEAIAEKVKATTMP